MLTLRAFWRAEQLIWVEKNVEEMRMVDQCPDEMKTVEKNFLIDDMWEEMGWDEKSWDKVRWGEKSSHDLRWDEVWSVKCKCEVWRVQCEVWGKCLLGVALHRGRAQVRFLDQHLRNSFAQSTHARAWLAHGAFKFYRCERSYSISLLQLPPRLVRVLLVYYVSPIKYIKRYTLH